MVINFGWANGNGDTIIFFNGLSDCMFYLLSFLLAVSSAKKFKTNEYMALALAGLLMYPFAIADGQQIIRIFGFCPNRGGRLQRFGIANHLLRLVT